VLKNLTFSDGFSTSFKLGMNQFFPILGAIILWLLTLWIPYINVGTSIGLIRLQIKVGRGESINSTEIFSAQNRVAMGRIFLLWSFMTTGIIIGFLFLLIPGIVLMYAWIFSSMIILDKKLDPLEAMSKSYDLTYGYKWVIFFIVIAIQIACSVPSVLVDPATWGISEYYQSGLYLTLLLISLIPTIFGGIWSMAAYGYMYSVLMTDSK
jgi:hypothetical protein